MGKYRKVLPHRVNRLIFNPCLPQVLPKKGQLIVQVQTAAPVAMQPERSNQEVSSGAGELSDSMSAAEVSNFRKKKSRVGTGAAAKCAIWLFNHVRIKSTTLAPGCGSAASLRLSDKRQFTFILNVHAVMGGHNYLLKGFELTNCSLSIYLDQSVLMN